MATERLEHANLISAELTSLVQVAFDNIEESRYYYVRRRDPDAAYCDIYGLVTRKTRYRVTIRLLATRNVNDNSSEESWIAEEGDGDNTYTADRELVRLMDEEGSTHFYLPELPEAS